MNGVIVQFINKVWWILWNEHFKSHLELLVSGCHTGGDGLIKVNPKIRIAM